MDRHGDSSLEHSACAIYDLRSMAVIPKRDFATAFGWNWNRLEGFPRQSEPPG